MPNTMSGNVMAAREATTEATGWPVSMVMPKSPCNSPPTHSKYCCGSGLSSPIWALNWATRSGGEFVPAITAAMSPGSTRSMRNTMSEIANSATRNMAMRRNTYFMKTRVL